MGAAVAFPASGIAHNVCELREMRGGAGIVETG